MTAGDRRRASDDLIAALACGASQAEAGAVAGVSERTVRRRLERPGFAERVRNERAALVARTSARLTALTARAVDTLADLLDASVPDAVRLRTALGALDACRVWREAGEVEERLYVIEQALSTQAQGSRSA